MSPRTVGKRYAVAGATLFRRDGVTFWSVSVGKRYAIAGATFFCARRRNVFLPGGGDALFVPSWQPPAAKRYAVAPKQCGTRDGVTFTALLH